LPDVIAVGNVNVDITASIPRWPRGDEKLVAERAHVCLGGAAANFAIACSRLGLSCGLIAVVGGDALGELALEELEARGVDVSHIARIEGAHTGMALILRAGQSRGIISCRGANEALSPEHIDMAYLASARLVLAASIRLGVAEALASACSELGIPLFLDPGGTLASRSLHELRDVLRAVQAFLPNEVELSKITGLKDIRASCEALASLGVRLVAVKAGARGCFIYDGERLLHVGALRPKRIVDRTGAGDAFNAGFTLGRLTGLSMLDSARLGIALATLKLGRPGASNMPDLGELRAFLTSIGWERLLEAVQRTL